MGQSLTIETNRQSSTADALVVGVAIMLAINVVQRMLGLVRNLGFTMFLPEDQLGLWALANSFFIIAPPFIVLGLPGSFGKFVEHYRQRGHLKSYLIQVGKICLIGLIGTMAIMLLLPDQVSVLLFGERQSFSIITWTVIALAVLTVHNFVYDVVLSMRLIRLISIMQFVNSFSFCVFGIAGIYVTKSWSVLLPSYAGACALAMLPGLYGIASARNDFVETKTIRTAEMWQRVLPFAAAVWLTNLLTNAYELCDRYMLLHLSNLGEEAGQALVGQYYCGRILPNLLLSLAMLFGGLVLPYLSVDWERQQFEKIAKSMNNILIVLCIAFTGLSVAALAAAPILFHWILSSRFNPALDILPLGMMQAVLSGLSMIAANYLLCAEKGRQNAIILAIGLLLNMAFNWLLITYLGLYGAAMATMLSNSALLLMICWRLHREGCRIYPRTVAVCLLPICLLLGVYVAAAIFLALAMICSRTDWLLTDEDRDVINRTVLPKLQKLGISISTLWLPR